MLKLLIPLVVVLVLTGGGFFLYKNFQTGLTPPAGGPTSTPQAIQTPTTATQPTSSPITSTNSCEVLTKGSADLPSLYKEGINWQQSTIAEYEVPLEDESLKFQGCLIKSEKTTDEVSLKATGYYDDNLQKLGWKTLVTASGVYSSTDSYQKVKQYFVVRRYVPSGTPQNVIPIPIMIELFYSP